MTTRFTCFLIDDDIDDQEIICTVLESIAPSSSCVTALNGYAALEMLRKEEVLPDIIFLDLNMPLMNGKQFLQRVKADGMLASVPIIVLTTSADQNTKAAVVKAGARQCVTKPEKFSEWENILKQTIEMHL